MKHFFILMMIILLPLSVYTNDSQAVWSKSEETDTKKCQLAIEQGIAVNLKTSKSLERTAYLYDGDFYMLTDYNEMIICFKYTQKEIKIK
tara:strand:+ start:341 stop:610 length:270 start_codon:yes stop_codon:yes gene_type:complete